MAPTLNMPTYEYHCAQGHHFEAILSVADYQTPQTCKWCGSPGRRVISVPRLGYASADVCYDSPIDGRPITSRAARLDDMRRNGCQEYDPEMRKDADRYQKERQAKLEAQFDTHIEREISSMDARKREKLAAELSSGADVVPTRK